MPPRRALFLAAHRLTAYRWQSGQLIGEGQFAADGQGLEAFTEYLVRQQHSLFYILAELADEAFRLEDIPCVQGRDRRALLGRKLEQNFHGTALNLALSIGRANSGRRDEKMLFTALTRPQHLEPWLAVLREQEGQLAGIYSIPLLMETLDYDLASKFSDSSRPHLMVTLSSGGLRQTFFSNGRLHFSRLIPLTSASPEQCAAACAEESGKTYHYLVGQRQIARGSALDTLMLTHPGEIGSFRNHCPDSAELHFKFIDSIAESQRAGLKTLPKDSRSEALFMHLMVKKAPRIQFAPLMERRFFHLWQMRRILTSSGAVILLSCLLFAGKLIFDGYRLSSETAQIQLQTASHMQRHAAIVKALPPLPTGIDKLVTLVERFEGLEKRSAALEPMVTRISHALQDTPHVQINRIDWQSGVSADESVRAGGRGRFTVIADVYAQLPLALGNDRRTLLAGIEDFSASLGKDGGTEVRVLKLPFDIASGNTLKSSHGSASGEDHGNASNFSLRIVEKP